MKDSPVIVIRFNYDDFPGLSVPSNNSVVVSGMVMSSEYNGKWYPAFIANIIIINGMTYQKVYNRYGNSPNAYSQRQKQPSPVRQHNPPADNGWDDDDKVPF